ncbi:hypothetical protein [Oceanicola sp. 22II-s10i]|uniref:hypothetical protein n=1 Tax=Oceanicola sp. 22II-s10i TaxID=1317116 RepID=UPI000B5230A0|nr:hypothetical protein [Oceanicola sp. 22II-s10i]
MTGPNEKQWRAVADLYHDVFLGLLLTVLSRKGARAGEIFMFNIFRRQQREKFLSGLEKLGIADEPPAVAAAKYHYLSNMIGGVNVEYMREHDGKAWIRYAPPRWAWKGVVLCAIPPKVSEAMLWGWHSNNGIMLGAPSMGFVCTKQAVDAQDGLEGYYFDYGRPLEQQERLRFARDEEAPVFDPAAAPMLGIETWPAERLAKAHRNYAMEYAKSALLEVVNTFGPIEGEGLMRLACRMVGMQVYRDMEAAFGTPDFAAALTCLIAAQGDSGTATGEGAEVRVTQDSWRLMADAGPHGVIARAGYEALLAGMGDAARRGSRVSVSWA